MIGFCGVRYTYPGGVQALRGVDFTVAPGQLAVLAGANGSGKSTVLHMAAGLLHPDSGTVRIGPWTLPGDRKDIRRGCALVFQDPGVQILGGTVEEDLVLGARGAGLGTGQGLESARELARKFGLLSRWSAPVRSLSGGQRKRLCLAAAMIGGKDILLMDEPLSGLDFDGICEMRDVLDRQKRQGMTLLVTGHDIEPLIDLADRLILFRQGRVLACGKPERILDTALEAGVRPPCSWTISRTISPWNPQPSETERSAGLLW